MIHDVSIKNLGVIHDFSTDRLSNINLIIGENGTGKTFLLKGLYASVKTMEQFHRGNNRRSVQDLLAEKLRWTFQTETLGELVTKGEQDGLSFFLMNDGTDFSFSFSKSAAVKIANVSSLEEQRASNSIFLPAKEIISLIPVILRSRDVDQAFGFDDTYYDLAKALQIKPHRGKNYKTFADSRLLLQNIVHGKVDYSEENQSWYFVNSRNQKFSIDTTSEGTKKIAILDRLLANGYLSPSSIIFIDEIESALHPKAIYDFLDIIEKLAFDMGIQIFIASHSYFVIKKLYLIALKRKQSVMCYSMNGNEKAAVSDLRDGMPDNSIIRESVRLYEEEVDQTL